MFASIGVGKSKAVGMLSYIWSMLDVNDDQDPYLRHAGVFAMQSMGQPMQLLTLRSHESAAVRKAAVIALGNLKHEGVGEFIEDKDPKVSDEAIRLIHDRGIESVRHLVAALATRESGRQRTPMMWRRILHSAFRVGGESNLKRLLEFSLNRDRPEDARQEALRLIGIWNEPPLVDQSLGRFAPLPSRDAAVSKAILDPKVTELMSIDGGLRDQVMKVIKSHRLEIASVADKRIKDMIVDAGLSDSTRLQALSIYADRDPEKLDAFLLDLTRLKSEPVAKSALVRLINRESMGSNGSMKALLGFMKSEDASRRRMAWPAAADSRDKPVIEQFVRGLNRLSENVGKGEDAVELLEAAKTMDVPEIKKALANFESKLKASKDPLAAWAPALLGGDPERGEDVFMGHPAAQCRRCHDAGAEQAGPILDGVALRGDRRFLLESLVNPAAIVAPGYGMVSVTLKDGSSMAGMLTEESPETVVLDLVGKKTSISRSEIAEISESVSTMPPMASLLSMKELRDLVAWLSTKNQK